MSKQYLQNLKLTIYTEKRLNEQKSCQLSNLQFKFDKVKEVLNDKVMDIVQMKQQNMTSNHKKKFDKNFDNQTQCSTSCQEDINLIQDSNSNLQVQNENVIKILDFSNEKNIIKTQFSTPNQKKEIYQLNQTDPKKILQPTSQQSQQIKKINSTNTFNKPNKKVDEFVSDIYIIGITENDFRIYLKTNEPIQPKFLYTNYEQNILQNNDRIQYLLGDKVEPFVIEIEPKNQSIFTLLLDQKNFFNQFQFYCINLNSEKMSDRQYKQSQKLYETNVCNQEYYYCLKTFDFFVEHNKNNQISFNFFEKVFVIKTLLPIAKIHYKILKNIFNLSRKKKLQFLKDQKFILNLQEKNYQKSLNDEINIIQSFIYETIELNNDQIDNDKVVISLQNDIKTFNLPDIKYRSFASSKLFDNVLKKISFESFLFIWLSLINEKSIVFIGQNKFDTTGAIQVFTSLLYPFKWTYPILSNLTEQCYSFLSSPVPLIASINKPPQFVLQNLIPQHAQKLGSNNIYYFIDFDVVYCKSNDLQDITIPNFFNQIETLQSIYKRINQKKNAYIQMSKADHKFTFQRKNFESYKNQMIKLGTKEYSIQNDFLTYIPSDTEFDYLFLFIKRFWSQFILSILPFTKEELLQLQKGEFENLALQYFPYDLQDKIFFQNFIQSQGFSYHISNNQFIQ